MTIYKTVITFETDRDLTDEELNQLESNFMLQIEDPTNKDNEAEEYETQLLNIETKWKKRSDPKLCKFDLYRIYNQQKEEEKCM